MMNQAQVDELLYRLQLYAEATLNEWMNKNPEWVPAWVGYVNNLSEHLRDGGVLPSQWKDAKRG